MSNNQTITFLEAVEVRDHNNKIEFSAEPGEVVPLATASAQRWIRRGLAVDGEIAIEEAESEEAEAPQQTAPKKKAAKADK